MLDEIERHNKKIGCIRKKTTFNGGGEIWTRKVDNKKTKQKKSTRPDQESVDFVFVQERMSTVVWGIAEYPPKRKWNSNKGVFVLNDDANLSNQGVEEEGEYSAMFVA